MWRPKTLRPRARSSESCPPRSAWKYTLNFSTPPACRLALYWSKKRASRTLSALRPSPNSLSLLRTCSRISDEVGDSWLGQVLISFEDVKTMLDKLTSLDSQTLGKLRHMRYSERRLTREFPARRTSFLKHQHGLLRILKLLPGLCLDRLTVLGHHNKVSRYCELDNLIIHSDGWEGLHYLSWNSEMLGFPEYDETRRRKTKVPRAPQP